VPGMGGPIPIMAHGGEYVINAASTTKHRPLVEAINEDRVQALAGGGPILRGSAGFSERSYGISRAPDAAVFSSPRLSFQGGGIVPSISYTVPASRSETKQITIEGDINIVIPASAAPQRPEDWRYITREFILPEIKRAGV